MDDAGFITTLIAQARGALERQSMQPARMLLDRALVALNDAPPESYPAARLDLAQLLLSAAEPERAAYALGAAEAPSLRRRAVYETAAGLRSGTPPVDATSSLIRRLMQLPDFSAAAIRRTHTEVAALLGPHEHVTTSRPVIDTHNVYTICMTPRSGSNFLVDCLTATGLLGRPGEYLHREEPTALPSIVARFRTGTLDAAMAEIMARTRSPNSVFGIKAHINMLLPLLIEGTFARTLASGGFIYTTREDVLAQAISFVRAQMTGVWISKNKADGEPHFDFARIHATITDLSTVMTQWETFFALHGIRPLRVTYEAINRDVDAVVAEIADYLGVGLAAPTRFWEHRETVQRDAINQEWRQRFLAEAGAGSG